MYFLTLLFIFLLLVFCVMILKEDIISPSVMFCFGYLFTLIMLPISCYYFKYTVGAETYCIILFGAFVFVLFSQIIKYLTPRFIFNNFRIEKLQLISLHKISYFIIFIVPIITLCYLVYVFCNIVNFNSNFGDLSLYINKFRQLTAKNIVYLPFSLNQLLKISKCLAYVCIYIYFNNSIFKNNYFKNIYFLFPALIFVFISILRGARFDILEFIIIGFFLLVFFKQCNGSKIKITLKSIKNYILIFILLVAFFSFSKYILGRSQSREFWEYLSFYFGNSIMLLDFFLDNFNGTENIYFGQESFYPIYSLLYKIGLIEHSYSTHLEFAFYNGSSLGNVYTGYRSLINDFGYIGMFIMHAIFSILINLFYYYVRYKKRKPIDIFLIFYLYLASMPVLHFFICRFFYIFSINYLSIFVTIFIMSVVLNAKFVKL